MSTAFLASKPIPSIFNLAMGQNTFTGLQRKSWNNLHALNEWRIVLNKKDSVAYHQKVWQTDLLCPGEGNMYGMRSLRLMNPLSSGILLMQNYQRRSVFLVPGTRLTVV